MEERSPEETAPAGTTPYRSAEVRLVTSGAAWSADVEEASALVRLRLHPAMLGSLPVWNQGRTLQCTLSSHSERYYAEASVVRQDSDRLWLQAPYDWLRADRRADGRMAGGFPVTYSLAGGGGAGVCADISVGGMCLCVEHPLPIRVPLGLVFMLPGEPSPVSAAGTAVYGAPAGEPGRWNMGIQFGRLLPEHLERIARYCGGPLAP